MNRDRIKTPTFAFDTENVVMLDGKVIPQEQLAEQLKPLSAKEMRSRVSCHVWAWQIYDEFNGFFMTEDFEEFLEECCLRGYKFGWCYNASFDFSQIDYQILAKGKGKWSWHEHKKVGYDRSQPYTYTCLQNDMGARYSYKIWFPYTAKNRHRRTHAIEIRDFMKFCVGGLKKVFEDLDVRDNEGNKLRKLEMDYQAVNIHDLTDEERAYCEMDVKALYFAVKQFNGEIERISEDEAHIFGKETNLITSGGLAKKMLLKSLYPDIKPWQRLKQFQIEHPLTPEQDKFLRKTHLYRGGISFLNPRYKGKFITRKMYRYDVNSEYPYAMSQIRTLVGTAKRMTFAEWEKTPKKAKKDLEAVYCLTSLTGDVRKGMLGIFYNPFTKEFENHIEISDMFLIFERELQEYMEWYDLEFEIKCVLVWKRGERIYKPFVEKYYPLKSSAENTTFKKVIKLILNSAYGKLSQRIEVVEGRYELNEETDSIHYVIVGESEEEASRMSIVDGSLVTSFARCYILSKIREICPCPAKDFVYIDTDSIHCFNKYEKADPKKLGGLKLEMETAGIKYLAPKTYVDIVKFDDGKIELGDVVINSKGDVEIHSKGDVEIHSKGVNVKAIYDDVVTKGNPPYIALDRLLTRFDYGEKFVCLQAMNVKGGKALVPVEKYLAKKDLAPVGWEKVTYSNMAGGETYGEI